LVEAAPLAPTGSVVGPADKGAGISSSIDLASTADNSTEPKTAKPKGPDGRPMIFSARARNFRKAVFDRSNLRGIDFSGSDLSDSSMRGAFLQGAIFDCAWPSHLENNVAAESSYLPAATRPSHCTRIERANLTAAKLDGASFVAASMGGSSRRTRRSPAPNFARRCCTARTSPMHTAARQIFRTQSCPARISLAPY
jgi:hypothetical protein